MRKYLLTAIGAGALAFAPSTQCAPVNVLSPTPSDLTDPYPVSAIGSFIGTPGVDDANLLKLLGFAGPSTPTPYVTEFSSSPIDLNAGDYLVLLYAADTTTGDFAQGGIVPLYFDQDVKSFAFETADHPSSALGALVFAKVFDHVPVPDAGPTWMLSVMGLAALGWGLRRGWQQHQ